MTVTEFGRSGMNSMKNSEAILRKPGEMEICEAEIPVPKADEILIKVSYVGLCGSDVHAFEFGPYIPPKDPKQKIGLGHECSGIVVGVGKDVTGFEEGDRVVIEPGIPCGKCNFCLSGAYNLCTSMDFMATQPNYKGALTNYIAYPARMTYKLPQNLSMTEGALIEPAAVGMHAAMVAEVVPGKKIVILGSGCIGLMVLQACRALGANEIIVVDLIEKRLRMAEQLGAKTMVNGGLERPVERVKELFGEFGADIVFETAGSSATAKQALGMVSRGGKIIIVGTIPAEVPVNFLSINREVTIRTVFRYVNNFPMTIDAIASGRFNVALMVTDEYDYSNVQKAFEESISRKTEIIKAVIHIA